MHPLQPSENSFHALRNDRIAARNALSDQQRSFLDERLTFLVKKAMFHHHTRISLIARLLNKGATLLFNPHELHSPNLADIFDFLRRKTEPTLVHYIFNLLERIVSSACDSWATNRRYAGNGGIGIPQLLVAFVATGNVWASHTETTAIQMHHRHNAWSILRKMVWAYEHDRRTERYPICCKRLVTCLLVDFLCCVSNRERAAPLDPAELHLFETVVAFFRVRTTISKTICDIRRPYLTPLSAELLLRIDPKLFQNWHARYTSPCIFDNFLCNHIMRRNTLNLLAYESFRVYILQPEFVRDLCRRKERVIFERLYRLDPHLLMDVVPFALQVLESKLVRGRKERLIAFFKSIQDAQ